ncbi:MAG: hypothetical protein ACI9GW_002182 [Halieaceae bacterium]
MLAHLADATYIFVMRLLSTGKILFLASLFLAGSAWSQVGKYMYRYTNADGVVVIEYHMPPEAVRFGYEILYSDGTLYRRIGRALTDEEIVNRTVADKRKELEEIEVERLRRWDESLLLRYSSVEDIESARERTLGNLKIAVSILLSNVRSLNQQVESNQSKAADIERTGGDVPEGIISNIESYRSQIADAEQSIVERNAEMDAVIGEFQLDIERFQHLLDMVKVRRRAYGDNG